MNTPHPTDVSDKVNALAIGICLAGMYVSAQASTRIRVTQGTRDRASRQVGPRTAVSGTAADRRRMMGDRAA
ncbi:hypothetical protein ACH4GM_09570 [Streptomyces coeruleorubidus]|uniref:hypothetical protein n=1 Tax=Streptomyces coeruleorubidus TaxID=116188 RepID=UPI00379AFF90